MTTFLSSFILIYLVILIITILLMLIFPLLVIIECANRPLSRQKKTIWMVALVFLAPASSIAFGLIESKNRFYKWYCYVATGVISIGIVLALMEPVGMLAQLGKWGMIPATEDKGNASEGDESNLGFNTIDAMMKCMDGIPKATVQEDYEGAIQDFTAGINLAPHDAELARCYMSRGESYLKLGKRLQGQKDLKKSIQLAKMKLATDKNHAPALVTISDASKLLKRYKYAYVYLNKAIKADPKRYGYLKYKLRRLMKEIKRQKKRQKAKKQN